MCVPERDQNNSLLCISSSFLFNIGIVHHFHTVNHFDTVETGHMRTPSTCSRSPASSFQGLRKLGGGLGTRLRIHLISVWTAHDLTGQTLLRGLDEVSQLLHEISHYPARACAKGLRNRFCLSVCLSGEKF